MQIFLSWHWGEENGLELKKKKKILNIISYGLGTVSVLVFR